MATDFEDWTQGITVINGSIPMGADFPDWTTAVAVDTTSSGVIEEITSTGGTVTITNPFGPITNLEASGGSVPNPFDITVTGVDIKVVDSTPSIQGEIVMTNTSPGFNMDVVDSITLHTQQSGITLEAPFGFIALTANGDPTDIVQIDCPQIDIGISTSSKLGFFGAPGGPIQRQTITGSRGGNAALASLLTALANFGLITNSTTP